MNTLPSLFYLEPTESLPITLTYFEK